MDASMIHDDSSTKDAVEYLHDSSDERNGVVVCSSSESGSDNEANVNGRRDMRKSDAVVISSSDSDADSNVNSRCILIANLSMFLSRVLLFSIHSRISVLVLREGKRFGES